ncbi:hypothetical protein KCU64_g29, partial [Aureobasidium melanogenum]
MTALVRTVEDFTSHSKTEVMAGMVKATSNAEGYITVLRSAPFTPSLVQTLATLQTATSHQHYDRSSKSSYCRQVAIYGVRPSRSETTGANDPGHPCSSGSLVAFVRSLRDLASQGCSQQAESYGQALSISRSHSSLYPLIVAIIILSRRQKHKAWSNGLRKQNGTSEGSQASFRHSSAQPRLLATSSIHLNRLRCFVLLAWSRTTCFDSVCRFCLQALSLDLHRHGLARHLYDRGQGATTPQTLQLQSGPRFEPGRNHYFCCSGISFACLESEVVEVVELRTLWKDLRIQPRGYLLRVATRLGSSLWVGYYVQKSPQPCLHIIVLNRLTHPFMVSRIPFRPELSRPGPRKNLTTTVATFALLPYTLFSSSLVLPSPSSPQSQQRSKKYLDPVLAGDNPAVNRRAGQTSRVGNTLRAEEGHPSMLDHARYITTYATLESFADAASLFHSSLASFTFCELCGVYQDSPWRVTLRLSLPLFCLYPCTSPGNIDTPLGHDLNAQHLVSTSFVSSCRNVDVSARSANLELAARTPGAGEGCQPRGDMQQGLCTHRAGH